MRPGRGWHATRKLVLRNLSSRRLRLRVLADERDKGGARGLVFAFAPSRDPHPRRAESRASTSPRARCRQPDRRSRARSPCDPKGAPRCPGALARHLPALAVTGLSSVRLSTRSFGPPTSRLPCCPSRPGESRPGATRARRPPRPRAAARMARDSASWLSCAISSRRYARPDRSRRGGRDPRARPLSRAADALPTGEGPPSKASVAFAIR